MALVGNRELILIMKRVPWPLGGGALLGCFGGKTVVLGCFGGKTVVLGCFGGKTVQNRFP